MVHLSEDLARFLAVAALGMPREAHAEQLANPREAALANAVVKLCSGPDAGASEMIDKLSRDNDAVGILSRHIGSLTKAARAVH